MDRQVTNELPSARELPATFGFRSGARGTHSTRTMMLAELTTLLAGTPLETSRPAYLQAIVEENLLGKRTVTTRRLTAQRLSELYGLDSNVTLFRVLRRLWVTDPASQPLLACLCANARDPLLRLTSSAILAAGPGEALTAEAVAAPVAAAAPGRFSETTLHKIGRNAASSWTQSGHLRGRARKLREPVEATPEAAAYALLLGHLGGIRGRRLLETYWTRLLDTSIPGLGALAVEASRRGWIDYRQAGEVVHVGFPALLTPEEQEAADGQS